MRKFLRQNQTPTEKIIWEKLRNRKFLNLKFRRQHPIDNFIVVFYCAEPSFIIEIDGKVHEKQKEYDEFRQNLIERQGYQFLRITNSEIITDVNILLEKIRIIYETSQANLTPVGVTSPNLSEPLTPTLLRLLNSAE